MHRARALVRISKVVFVVVSLMLATLGALFFLSGFQSVVEGEHSDLAWGNIMLSVALVSFPLAIFFGYKSAKHYLIPTDGYQPPESPLKTLLYIALTGGFVLITVISIIVFLLYLNA